MKTVLCSLLTATLLGFISHTTSQTFDVVEFISVLFASGLLAWTVKQYDRQLPSLTVAQAPFHLPVGPEARQQLVHRLAA
jgi:hypothetical protein